MKQKVVVVGFGYTSRLGVIRAIGECGYEIIVIVTERTARNPLDYCNRYASKYYFTQGNHEDVLLQLLREKCIDENQKTILIPLNDWSDSVLDRNYDDLSKFFLFPHIHHKQGAITDWMNKEKQKDAACNVGLNVAKSVTVEIVARTYSLPQKVTYPCFTKTREFVTGYKSTLRKCDTEIELKEFLDFLCTKFENLELMVEDYKEIEKEYAVVGFSDGSEVVIPGVIEILNMAHGNDRGVAIQGKVMPIKGFEDLVERFKELMGKIGFVGMFDIDFYSSKGDYYFGEINLRIGGSGSAIMKMGVNLPVMFVKTMLGEPIGGMKKEITETATYVNERICSEDWYNGYLPTKDFFHILESSDISFVKDDKDLRPHKEFVRELRKMRLKKLVRKFLRTLHLR